jgi:hypothetical protein
MPAVRPALITALLVAVTAAVAGACSSTSSPPASDPCSAGCPKEAPDVAECRASIKDLACGRQASAFYQCVQANLACDASGKLSQTTVAACTAPKAAWEECQSPGIDAAAETAPPGEAGGADAAGDAGVPDGSEQSDGSDGGSCSSLTNSAPVVTPGVVVGPLPVGTGGAFPTGTYWAVAFNFYTADDAGVAPPITIQGTYAISAKVAPYTYTVDSNVTFSGTPSTSSSTLTVMPDGTLTSVQVCPSAGAMLTGTYTWDGASMQLHLYAPSPSGGTEVVLAPH